MKRAFATIIVLILAIGMVAMFFIPFLGASTVQAPAPVNTNVNTATTSLPK